MKTDTLIVIAAFAALAVGGYLLYKRQSAPKAISNPNQNSNASLGNQIGAAAGGAASLVDSLGSAFGGL